MTERPHDRTCADHCDGQTDSHFLSLSATNGEEAHELGSESWLIPNDFAICLFNDLTSGQIIVIMKLPYVSGAISCERYYRFSIHLL